MFEEIINMNTDHSGLHSINNEVMSDDELITRLLNLNKELSTVCHALYEKNTALKNKNNSITQMMHTDHLTGLANRRFFVEMLVKQISYCKRHHVPLSIVITDLDKFKQMNDNYGHHSGDQFLISFAAMMQNYSRKEDLPARFGGDEFVMMLPNVKALQAATFAERLRRAIENLEMPTSEDFVTASFGITQLTPEDSTDSFIKRSDEALYEAKRKGGNCVFLRDMDCLVEHKSTEKEKEQASKN